MHGRTLALAIDLGGTKVDAALVDADGAVVAGTVHRAPTGPDAATGRHRAGDPRRRHRGTARISAPTTG